MNLKSLLSGKKKFLTIPLIGLIGLIFLPISIGLLILWFAYKKIRNKKIKIAVLSVAGIITLFFGSAYVSALFSPSTITKPQNIQEKIENKEEPATSTKSDIQTTEEITPTPTPTFTPTPKPATTTPKPSPSFTPTPTPKPQQQTTTQQTQPVTNTGSWNCNCKKTCPQISSCAEAQYQLNTCGCKQRDADGDGIACDKEPLFCEN